MNKKYDVLWNIEQLGPVDEYKKEIYNDTIYYQKKFGFEKSADPTHATWNNEADAFKHGYMQAWGTFVNGELFAKLGGQLHERNGNLYMGQPTNEENMDLWNNEVGLRIGKKLKREIKNYKSFYTERQIKDMVAAKVYEYIKRGMFITDPKDTRKYYELMQLSSDQKSKDLDKIEKQQEKFDLQISKEKYLKNKERNSEKRLFSELKRELKNLKDIYSLDLKTKNGKRFHFQSGKIPANTSVISQSRFTINTHNYNDLAKKIIKMLKNH